MYTQKQNMYASVISDDTFIMYTQKRNMMT